MGDQTKQPGPDEAFKLHAVPEPDETDVEGHSKAVPDEPGPDESFRFKAVPDEPGSDETWHAGH